MQALLTSRMITKIVKPSTQQKRLRATQAERTTNINQPLKLRLCVHGPWHEQPQFRERSLNFDRAQLRRSQQEDAGSLDASEALQQAQRDILMAAVAVLCLTVQVHNCSLCHEQDVRHLVKMLQKQSLRSADLCSGSTKYCNVLRQVCSIQTISICQNLPASQKSFHNHQAPSST